MVLINSLAFWREELQCLNVKLAAVFERTFILVSQYINYAVRMLFWFYYVNSTLSRRWSKSKMTLSYRCPGLYCGRELFSNGSWSDCGACPRGFRANTSSFCVPCSNTPVLYDWLYLGFMTFSPLVLHWFCIDNTTPFRGRYLFIFMFIHK